MRYGAPVPDAHRHSPARTRFSCRDSVSQYPTIPPLCPPTRVNGEGPGNNRDSLHASGPPLSCHAMCWGHHRQGEIWDRGNPCWHAKSPKREFPAPGLTLPDCSVAATLSSHTRTPAGCRHPSPSAELPAGPDSRNTPGISHPPGDRQLASAGR